MSDCILTHDERKGFNDLQLKAAELRLKKIKGEEEFIELKGKDLSPEECAALENKRHKILHQLELEGAHIEREYIEKYRSRILDLGMKLPGEFGIFGSCIICERCVTSTCLDCTACSSCVLVSSL